MRKVILIMVLAVVSNSAICENRDNLIKNDDVTQQIELAKQFVLAKVFFENYAKNHPISDAKPDQRERLQLQSIEKVKAELRAKAKIKTSSSGETAALVNGVPIPQARINLRVKIEIGEGKTDSPELRKAMQEKMIDLELVVQEANKLGLNKNEEVVQQIELAKQGVLVSTFVQDHAKNHPISEEQLKREYDASRAKLGNKEYNVRHILVDTEDEAKFIIAQLAKNDSKFEMLANKSKDANSATKGGSLGWAVPGDFAPPFAKAVLNLKKGERTKEPVRTQFGWHIIMLEDIRDLKVPSFDEVKTKLQQRLQQQSIEKVIADLRAKAKIETASSAETAALVNGVPIPQTRINLRAKIEIGEGKTDSPEFRKAILDDLINVEVIAQEAAKYGEANVSNSAEVGHATIYGLEFGKPLNLPKCGGGDSPQPEGEAKVCLYKSFYMTVFMGNYVYFTPDAQPLIAKKGTMTLTLDGDRLVGLSFYTHGYSTQSLVLQQLTEKYGKPTSSDISVMQNGMGAQWQVINAVWNLNSLYVTFSGVSSNIDSGKVFIALPEVIERSKANSARQNELKM